MKQQEDQNSEKDASKIIFRSSESGYDESTLWANFQNGDAEAIVYFYKKYRNDIMRFMLQYVARDTAKDILQELFLRLIHRKEKLSKVSMVKQYLFKSAYSIFKDQHKQNQKRSEVLQLARHEITFHSQQMTTERLIIDQEIAHQHIDRLEKSLSGLMESHREVLLLYYYQGFTLKEIGEFIGKSEDAIRKQVDRALKKLKEHM